MLLDADTGEQRGELPKHGVGQCMHCEHEHDQQQRHKPAWHGLRRAVARQCRWLWCRCITWSEGVDDVALVFGEHADDVAEVDGEPLLVS